VLTDFEMNALCAAGTGSFLDQQAERLGVSIEREFADLALQAEKPANIAGRCTVFAKSDMIHLQQRGVPLPEILSGLCYALARNFKSVIGRGKRFRPPILFQGGVASNRAVVRTFENVLDLEPGEIVIPEHHRLMAALGAALTTIDAAEQDGSITTLDLGALLAALRQPSAEPSTLPPLPQTRATRQTQSYAWNGKKRLPVYLGIDVGSISTNVVLIDGRRQVVVRRYLRTAGRPLDAVRQVLGEIGAQIGERVQVCGVGVTGSGRYLTGAYVGADVVRNEITSQARAAVEIDPTVDTVFEIGGQDSKYIRLERGVVLDFTMNKACAAGTGSFLEEQADKLEISVERDFGRLALCADAPACLGERCTVFMESNLVHSQQQGASVEDLTAGLAYSIAQNYLNRVVNGRSVGQNVFFQGGVASNPSVVAAFRQLVGDRITVPPHHDVTGAIGAAILAEERAKTRESTEESFPPRSRFHGFDLRARDYRTSVFECKSCVNQCEITRVHFGHDRPLFYGARCERYEEAGTGGAHAQTAAALPDWFARREALLLAGHRAPEPESTRPRVGIPRTLLFYELFPFWHRLLVELGADVVLSDATNPRTVRDTQAHTPAETCFPVKLMQGHVLNLVEQGADWVLLPSVVSREPAPGQENSTLCPFIQSVPHLVLANLDLAARGVGALHGPIYLDERRTLATEARRALADLVRPLGARRREIDRAVRAAQEAQRAFADGRRQLGHEALAELDSWPRTAVLIGRPYNTNDPGLSSNLPYKLRKLGVVPLPMDCLPLDTVDVSDRYDNMYWQSGQKIMAAARYIRQEPRLQAIYVTHFGCGPDSFLLGYFRREMAGRLYLELELDDHTADAGVNTRCEAFFDSLATQELHRGTRRRHREKKKEDKRK
jgi:predicted CoA-substrate-specific enzyme activase